MTTLATPRSNSFFFLSTVRQETLKGKAWSISSIFSWRHFRLWQFKPVVVVVHPHPPFLDLERAAQNTDLGPRLRQTLLRPRVNPAPALFFLFFCTHQAGVVCSTKNKIGPSSRGDAKDRLCKPLDRGRCEERTQPLWSNGLSVSSLLYWKTNKQQSGKVVANYFCKHEWRPLWRLPPYIQLLEGTLVLAWRSTRARCSNYSMKLYGLLNLTSSRQSASNVGPVYSQRDPMWCQCSPLLGGHWCGLPCC